MRSKILGLRSADPELCLVHPSCGNVAARQRSVLSRFQCFGLLIASRCCYAHVTATTEWRFDLWADHARVHSDPDPRGARTGSEAAPQVRVPPAGAACPP